MFVQLLVLKGFYFVSLLSKLLTFDDFKLHSQTFAEDS